MEIECVNLRQVMFCATSPYTRNSKGMLVQKPYFAMKDMYTDDVYHFNGRDIMWAFLDSLFPNNPLPRGVVDDDIFAPDVDTPSMLMLFNDFKNESISEGNEYLVLMHEDYKVRNITSLDGQIKMSEVEIAGAEIYRITKNQPDYMPFKYRDKNGVHLRPSVYAYINKCMLQIVDLGSRWYIRMIASDLDGATIGVIPPIAIKKDKVGDLRFAIRSAIGDANSYRPSKSDAKERMSPSKYLTREYDILLFNRKLGVGL